MDLDCSIGIDVLGIIALSFTINLAMRNTVIDYYKTKIYIIASAVTIVLTILEILTIIFQSLNGSNIAALHAIVNMIGFSLTPVVPYTLLLFNRKDTYYHSKLLLIPLIFNALLCMISYKTGWIFYVNSQNQYIRGSLFIIPTIISAFYYILLITSTSEQDFKYDKHDRIFLILAFTMPAFATLTQILFHKMLIIWGSVSLSLLLYYIFLRELQFKYDTLSEIKNRAAFEKELEQCQKNDTDVAIIVFDLNNFKKINDSFGHKAGDNAIRIAAQNLKESFNLVGEPYRIGGDEFCVICKNVSKQQVDRALLKLNYLTDLRNENQNTKVIFACGYDFYLKGKNKTIFETFAHADKLMYENKSKLKGLYGRRWDDI